MEGTTVEEADAIFAYFESKQKLWEEDWSAAWEGQGSAKLALLRFCNQLMKRLPRSLHAELCGRILIFCARLFPLSDKSGLNHQGHINTSHPIVIEDVKEVRKRVVSLFERYVFIRCHLSSLKQHGMLADEALLCDKEGEPEFWCTSTSYTGTPSKYP